MASCAITITGTTGTVLIKYTIGGNTNTITASPGNAVYVDTTATSITYTNISGDAAASSGCVSISNLPSNCFLFQWEVKSTICSAHNVFDAVLMGGTTYDIADVSISTTYAGVADAIRDLDTPLITPYSGKYDTTTGSLQNSLILQVLGTQIPQLRINNTDTSFKMYLIGTSTTCLPAGYTTIDNCNTSASPAP